MSYVKSIFYRKINPSDFKKMYGMDRPETGGGQTYIEAAGVDDASIARFLSGTDSSPSNLEPERLVYTAQVFALGSDITRPIEFAPRHNRNYKISRQGLANRHPAWTEENGFPEPRRAPDGRYLEDFNGIIDYLIIFIIRTSDDEFYAGFVNSNDLPSNWPAGVGLEHVFTGEVGKRRGVLEFADDSLLFQNDATAPFYTEDFTPVIPVQVAPAGEKDSPIDDVLDFEGDIETNGASPYTTQEEIDASNNRVPHLREGMEQNRRYTTDPRLGKTAIEKANHECELSEFDGKPHETFVDTKGNNYLEAHHLIPMKAQRYFEVNIDRLENLVALCPNCHRAVHYGSETEKRRYLWALYSKRRDALEAAGINIDFDDLLKRFY